MTDIRALVERGLWHGKCQSGPGGVYCAYLTDEEVRRLARAVLRLLESGDGMKKWIGSEPEVIREEEWARAVVAAWDAVAGEEGKP